MATQDSAAAQFADFGLTTAGLAVDPKASVSDMLSDIQVLFSMALESFHGMTEAVVSSDDAGMFQAKASWWPAIYAMRQAGLLIDKASEAADERNLA